MAISARPIYLLYWLLYPLGVHSLQVTPNSPCATTCQSAGSGDTTTADITCQDSDYGSSLASLRWQNCMTCLQSSTYTSGGQNDQMWFLFNMRYAVATCLFQFNNSTGLGPTPCTSSTACGDLQPAFQDADLSPSSTTQYGYCSDNGKVMTSGSFANCMDCVAQSDDLSYLVNYIVALGVGCVQQPSEGKTVALNGSVFSSSIIGASNPDASRASSGLSSPTIEIICLVVVIVLGAASVGGFYFYKRRKLQQKGAASQKTISPGSGGHARQTSDLSFWCRTNPEPDKDRPSTGFSSEQAGSISAAVPSSNFAQEQQTQAQDSTMRNTAWYPEQPRTLDMNGLPYNPDDRDLPPLPVAPLKVRRAEPANRESVAESLNIPDYYMPPMPVAPLKVRRAEPANRESVAESLNIPDYYLAPRSTKTTNFRPAMPNAGEDHRYSLTPADYRLTARQQLTMSYRSSVYSLDSDAPWTNNAKNEPMPGPPMPTGWGWWGRKGSG